MGRALQLGSVAGIRLQVHWTFLLIVAWVLYGSFKAGASVSVAAFNLGFVLVLFGCVILHELGHALAARMYGIPTRDITLLPIGGIARLERMPRKPQQELVVALAGPAVNVVIAGVLAASLLLLAGPESLPAVPMLKGNFFAQLMWVNIGLIVFNMLPAFPLDGGRVLRALIAFFTDYAKATRIAARIGQILAVGLGLVALYPLYYGGDIQPFLLIIAMFIFLGAAGESRMVQLQETARRAHMADGILSRLEAIPAYLPVRVIASRLLSVPQEDYPVVDNGMLIGIVRREQLLQALESSQEATVGEVLRDQGKSTVEPYVSYTP